MCCGTPGNKGGRGTARNNNSTYGDKNGTRTNKLDVSALGLGSPLGGGAGRGLGALDVLHAIVGLGGPQTQQTQLAGLLGGGTGLPSTGDVSNNVSNIEAMADATTALRLLALELAKVYKPCALQIRSHTATTRRRTTWTRRTSKR